MGNSVSSQRRECNFRNYIRPVEGCNIEKSSRCHNSQVIPLLTSFAFPGYSHLAVCTAITFDVEIKQILAIHLGLNKLKLPGDGKIGSLKKSTGGYQAHPRLRSISTDPDQ